MLVHYWISSTPPPCPATPLSVKTNLVLGISTDLFKNTIYISFGQGWDGTGDQFKIDICQGQHRQKDRPEIYGTTLRGIINQNVKEAGPVQSNSIPTEQVYKRASTHPAW